MPAQHKQTDLLIIFVDLTRFAAESERVTDALLADAVDAYYEHVAERVHGAGGRVVKFIGDAALCVFEEARVDAAVAMLLELTSSVDRLMTVLGLDCRLRAKAHFGPVREGLFGASQEKRYDVIGKTVNVAATLASNGVTLSVPAFRKLGSEMRGEFKKHTPPVTYIRTGDRRPR